MIIWRQLNSPLTVNTMASGLFYIVIGQAQASSIQANIADQCDTMATNIYKLGTHDNHPIPLADLFFYSRTQRTSRPSQPIHTCLRNLYILRNSAPTNPNSTNQKSILDQRQPTSKNNNTPIGLFNPIQPSSRIRLIQQRSTGYPIEEHRSASFLYGNVYAAGVCVVHAEEGYEEAGGVDDGDVLGHYGGCGFFCCGDDGGGLGGGDVVALWKG